MNAPETVDELARDVTKKLWARVDALERELAAVKKVAEEALLTAEFTDAAIEDANRGIDAGVTFADLEGE